MATAAGRAPRRGSTAAMILLVAGLAAAGILILSLDRAVSFYLDEWEFVLGRRGVGLDAFLAEHNGHLMLFPVAIYKLLIAAFGIDSPRPFQVVSVLTLLAAIALAYVYMRRRVGPWLALALVAPLAVCGAGWDGVLWPFQIGFTGSIAFGIGTLLVLERETSRADALACLLLTVSICFSSLGWAFAAGAVAQIAIGRRAWRRRAFVVAVPAVLYAGWWLGWGHEAESFASFRNLTHSPEFVFDGLSSSLASLLGLGTIAAGPDSIDTLTWGRPLMAVLLVVAGAALLYRRSVPRIAWPAIATALAFWLMTAVNSNFLRAPDTSRYQLIGAVLLALALAGLLRGVQPGRVAIGFALVAAAAAVAGNLHALHVGRDIIRDASQVQRADFTAIEIARDSVDPGFTIGGELAGIPLYGDAAAYLAAVEDHGSPGYGVDGLSDAPEHARAAADRALAAALEIALAPADRSATDCTEERLAGGPLVTELAPPAGLLIAASESEVAPALARYARESFPVELAPVAEDAGVVLRLPADRSRLPWRLRLSGTGSATLCELAAR